MGEDHDVERILSRRFQILPQGPRQVDGALIFFVAEVDEYLAAIGEVNSRAVCVSQRIECDRGGQNKTPKYALAKDGDRYDG